MGNLYADRAELVNNPVFLGRTRNAAMRYALYLSDGDDHETGVWTLATQVLTSPDTWTRQFALAVSTEPETLSGAPEDPAIDSAEGDTALQYAMENRVWPAFADSLEP
jgi:hypothetical protein